MTTNISVLLNEVKRIEDIVIFENKETNLMYFRLEFQDQIMTCPDEKSAFLSISVYSQVIICRLPQWSKNSSEEIATSKEKYRIFLRKEREWLINPEIKEALDSFPVLSREKDIKNAINFTQIIEIKHDYIHLGCQSAGVENRVYVFSNKHWISVPYSDLGISYPVTHFDKARLHYLKGGIPCLILLKEKAMNPLSLYFLPSIKEGGKYLEIPNAKDYQEKYPNSKCAVFRNIFSNYIVVAIGSGFSTTPKYFELYRLNSNNYLPNEIDNEGNLIGDNVKFENEYFTENYILVKEKNNWIPLSSKEGHSENLFSIISTQTWRVTPLAVEYFIGSTTSIVRPEIENGEITGRIPMPETVKLSIDSRFHSQKKITK
ncbi:MAG: hypothetical protein NT068_01535 [Candidatus Nomurabacteria bacterium]|nr:hypothetical protein [Candidatus Nomurabacteria bacterium]